MEEAGVFVGVAVDGEGGAGRGKGNGGGRDEFVGVGAGGGDTEDGGEFGDAGAVIGEEGRRRRRKIFVIERVAKDEMCHERGFKGVEAKNFAVADDVVGVAGGVAGGDEEADFVEKGGDVEEERVAVGEGNGGT